MSEYEKSYYPIINVEIFMDEHIDHTFQERLKFGEYNLDDFSMDEDFTQSLKNKIPAPKLAKKLTRPLFPFQV